MFDNDGEGVTEAELYVQRSCDRAIQSRVRCARYVLVLVLVLELEMRQFATATVVLTGVRLSQKECVQGAA
jgi:hypothetical protein